MNLTVAGNHLGGLFLEVVFRWEDWFSLLDLYF